MVPSPDVRRSSTRQFREELRGLLRRRDSRRLQGRRRSTILLRGLVYALAGQDNFEIFPGGRPAGLSHTGGRLMTGYRCFRFLIAGAVLLTGSFAIASQARAEKVPTQVFRPEVLDAVLNRMD